MITYQLNRQTPDAPDGATPASLRTTMKTTVIYHSADFDGIFCREIARKFLPDAELIGWDFADKPLPIPDGKIYILDLPVDRVFGIECGTISIDFANLVWIDHHKTSIASHPADIPGYRIDGVAACRLAWQYFEKWSKDAIAISKTLLPTKDDYAVLCPDGSRTPYRIKEPLAVRLAGEYDVWDHRGDGDLEFQFGLRSRKLSEHDWFVLLSQPAKPPIEEIERLIVAGHKNLLTPDGEFIGTLVAELLKDGKLLMDYQAGIDASTVNHRSFLIEFEGLKFLALNTARCNSLTFTAKDVPETGHDALMGFFFNGQKWTVSLYHAKHRTDIDLSAIAKKYGGGGHRGACGFVSNSEFLNFPKNPLP